MSETKKVVTAVDKSTKALNKAAEDLSKVASVLVGLTTATESLAGDIQVKEGELASIETSIAESERVAKADLKVRITENEDHVLDNLLSSRLLAKITLSELSKLENDLLTANRDNAEEVSLAVAQAEKSAAISANAVKSNLEAKHSVETAELKADKTALDAKVSFLESTVTDLKEMIAAERTARVSMSENASQPTINVSSAK